MNALRREYGARRASLSWPLSREEICLPGHAQRFAWEETPGQVNQLLHFVKRCPGPKEASGEMKKRAKNRGERQ